MLAPHLTMRFALAAPTVLHRAHRMLGVATCHFSAYPPPTRNHAYLLHCALRMLSDPSVCVAMAEYSVFLVTLMRALAEYVSADCFGGMAGGVVHREVVKWMVKVQLRYAKAAATRDDWERVLRVAASGGEENEEEVQWKKAVLAKVVAEYVA